MKSYHRLFILMPMILLGIVSGASTAHAVECQKKWFYMKDGQFVGYYGDSNYCTTEYANKDAAGNPIPWCALTVQMIDGRPTYLSGGKENIDWKNCGPEDLPVMTSCPTGDTIGSSFMGVREQIIGAQGDKVNLFTRAFSKEPTTGVPRGFENRIKLQDVKQLNQIDVVFQADTTSTGGKCPSKVTLIWQVFGEIFNSPFKPISSVMNKAVTLQNSGGGVGCAIGEIVIPHSELSKIISENAATSPNGILVRGELCAVDGTHVWNQKFDLRVLGDTFNAIDGAIPLYLQKEGMQLGRQAPLSALDWFNLGSAGTPMIGPFVKP